MNYSYGSMRCSKARQARAVRLSAPRFFMVTTEFVEISSRRAHSRPSTGHFPAEDRMTLLFRSWYLARSLGVTRTPPSSGVEYSEVKVEGGPLLFWPVVPEPVDEVSDA